MKFRRTPLPLSQDQADLETRLRGRSIGMPAEDLRSRVLSRVAQELSLSRQHALHARRFNWRVAAGLAAGFVVAATLSSVAAQTTHYGLAMAQSPVPAVRGGGASAGTVDVPLAGAYRQAQLLARAVERSGAARSGDAEDELPPWSQLPLRKVAP